MPIAVGENLHTAYRFAEFLRAGAAQIVQPNIVRVGGITPFRRIADVAAEHGATLHPHLLPELSGQLALTLPSAPARPSRWPRTSRTPASARSAPSRAPRPSRIADGTLTETAHLGLGIRFTRSSPDSNITETHR